MNPQHPSAAADPVQLSSSQMAVTVLPGKGCDIVSLTDRRTGVDVLLKTPWPQRPPGTLPPRATSQMAWLDRYPGGWQLLVPNGGPDTEAAGTTWGFHGEACLLPWALHDVTPSTAHLSVELFTAPLRIERRLTVTDATLRVEERITNTAPVPLDFMWSHHPAFGAPFLEAGCRLETTAATFRTDDVTSGGLLAPDQKTPWPTARARDGAEVDLREIPGPDQPREGLGYLTDFPGEEATAAITNPRLALTARLRWPRAVFPHAWLWQEVHGTPGFPWFKRLYTVAVEPASTIPGLGLAAAVRRGGHPVHLDPHGSRDAWVELELEQSSPA